MTKHRTIHTDEKPFECWLCHKTFGMRGNLKRHLLIHTICPKLRIDIDEANKQAKLIKLYGDDEPIIQLKHKCKECDRLFVRKSVMTEHYFLVHTNERPFECWLCHKTFKKKSNMKKHLEIHTICSEIRLKIDVAKKRAKLMKIYGGSEPIDINRLMKYECVDCGKYFTKNATLRDHRMALHSRIRPFECWLCHKTFKLKKQLKSHIKVHLHQRKSFEPNWICEFCGQAFKGKQSLTDHVQRAHSDDHPHKCEQCEKRFKTRTSLCEHIQIFHQNRRFDCTQCDKTFQRKHSLKRHVETHARCEKTIPHIHAGVFSSFRNHQELAHDPSNKSKLSYSDFLSFKCDTCGLGYKTKELLRKHRKTHTELQHKCTQCNRAFRQNSSLRAHMETHTGVINKPNVCDVCGKGFRKNYDLTEHRRIHTGEKPFKCEHCASNFRTISSFYGHLRKNHGISISERKREERARATELSTSASAAHSSQ